jgi:hypothetical protein
MNLETLNVTHTNSAEEAHGKWLGLDQSRLGWVLSILFLGLACFAVLAMRGAGLSTAFWVILVPAGLAGLVLVLLVQNRHPSYAQDLAENILTGGDAPPCASAPPHRGSLFNLMPDGYFVNDLMVFNSLSAGGWVARGYFLEVPDLQHASAEILNRFAAQERRLMRLLSANHRLQILWTVDANYQEALLSQKARIGQTDNAEAQRENNFAFLHFLGQMKRGELRRQRVVIVISRAVDRKASAPWRRSQAEQIYTERLAAFQTEFAELGRNLHSLLAAVGGSATPMTDADHFRHWYRALNPASANHRAGFDPIEAFDPQRSILENCLHSPIRGRGFRGFWLDECEHGVLVLKRWPTQTYPTILHRLTQLPFNDYSITVQIQALDAADLVTSTQRKLDKLNTQLAVKPDARQMVTKQKLEEGIQRLTQREQVPLSIELIIVVWAPTAAQLSERMLAIKTAMQGMPGAQGYEGLPAFSKNSFIKSLPGCSWTSHRGVELLGDDAVVADMLPLTSSANGHLDEAEVICLGNRGNLVGLKTVIGEGAHRMPANMLCVGAPGMGKSLFIKNFALRVSPLYAFYFIVEEGLSHAALSRSFGVEPIIWGLDGRQSLNGGDTEGLPWCGFHQANWVALIARMAGLPADEDKARYRLALLDRQVHALSREFADHRLRQMSEAQRRELLQRAMAVHHLATEKNLSLVEAFIAWRSSQPAQANLPGLVAEADADTALWEFESLHPQIVRDMVFTTLGPEQQLRLSALKEHLRLNATGSEREACVQLATLLEPFCGDGIYGPIFDRPTNVSLTGRIVHFELGQIPESATDLKALIAFLIVNRIRQHLITLPRHLRKMLILEELSRFLNIPGSEKLVRELYEQMRKTNTIVVSILQQFARLTDPSLRAAIIGCSPTFLIFNPGDRTDLALLAGQIGLSDTAQEAILRYARPSSLAGRKFSEFTYYHVDPNRPVCVTVRHFQFTPPTEAGPSVNPSTP